MKRLLIGSILLVMLMTATSYGFDGMRKGFVLGGGLGFCPNATWKFEATLFGSPVELDDNGSGVGVNFIIGYAWNEYNMVVYEGNVGVWKSELLMDMQVGQGFNGASWYHYFGEPGSAFFTAAGLGFYIFQVEQYENTPGLGFLAGAGYEFTKHVQAGAYFSYGMTSEPGVDWNHMHINILVSAVAF